MIPFCGQVMSNGEYKSIEHRTVLDQENERFSIAAFHFPNVNAVIGPLQDLVQKNGELYKTLSNDEFFGLFQKGKLEGKSILYHMKLVK